MPAPHKFYKTGRWQKLRRAQLAREPLCAECFKVGRIEPAVDVHHQPPWRTWDEFVCNPLVSLCHSCHSRRQVPRDFQPGTDADGYPTDKQRHPAYRMRQGG